MKLLSLKFPLFLVTSFVLVENLFSQQTLSIPQGSLKALQEKVLAGSRADIEWKISYPIHNFNETDAQVTVQFITAAIGPNPTFQFGTRAEGQAYEEFYQGVSEENSRYDLAPGTVVSTNFVEAHSELEFLLRHSRSRVPGGWVSSVNPEHEHLIVTVENGDLVPDVAPVPGQRSVADILVPYSKDGVVTIGDNQQILLFEIFTTDTSHFGFDLQDVVLLVSYEQVEISN